MHYLFNDTVNNPCLRCNLGIYLEGLEKILSLRIFGAPAMQQTGHNTKNKALLPQPTYPVGQNKKNYVFEMVRLLE
jgi:hypothetical protein